MFSDRARNGLEEYARCGAGWGVAKLDVSILLGTLRRVLVTIKITNINQVSVLTYISSVAFLYIYIYIHICTRPFRLLLQLIKEAGWGSRVPKVVMFKCKAI